jgi:hypothetical protein
VTRRLIRRVNAESVQADDRLSAALDDFRALTAEEFLMRHG